MKSLSILVLICACVSLTVSYNLHKKGGKKNLKKHHHRSPIGQRDVKPADPNIVTFLAYDEHGNLVTNKVNKSELNTPKVDECNFAKKREYPLCLTLTSCELCVRSPRCGWCDSTKKCVATACNKECPSIQGHPTFKHMCGYNNQTVYGGTFSTLTTEATKTINPEITGPKVAITTTKVTHGTTTF